METEMVIEINEIDHLFMYWIFCYHHVELKQLKVIWRLCLDLEYQGWNRHGDHFDKMWNIPL